ncbi:Inositolphosphorylceramide synthase subunit Kei1-domain-containing protein [Cokeromyces recurvatus]|uniref:Inositolphosphorylceramide synthase subunit Kei1-domain-containing protein n=1 Tax=Cokeromyces recurvatus TaxID=90255 RepID=UPI00221F649D|nr:Inositolphosphorylceramide synthase subunit Kei1-domain-containing protein [Cokeromyces recurvatus]KAI7907028.1 Inositolphosphorylceramide synthase subunit Kei1-domain-containing protein [Cokeromyces recurvatus]
MAIFKQSSHCCFLIPIKTGVYLITIFGLLNKLSGFYGLIALDYSDPIVVCVHIYSLIALGLFSLGLYGIHNDKYTYIRYFTLFYWFDFLISTATTIYFAIQWFVYTDHNLLELQDDPVKKQQHDDAFRIESTVSIIWLCLIRVIHLYFAYTLTCYYVSLGKAHYSKITASVDEELNFSGYNELEEEEEEEDKNDNDTSPLAGRRRQA